MNVGKSALLWCKKPKDGFDPSPQLPHIDFEATLFEGILVAITAHEDFSLLVWLGSHHKIRAVLKVHEAFKVMSPDGTVSEEQGILLDKLMADQMQMQVI